MELLKEGGEGKPQSDVCKNDNTGEKAGTEAGSWEPGAGSVKL
jgi:hypothetical protein